MNRNYSREEDDSYVAFGGLPEGTTTGVIGQHTIDPDWPSSWTIKMNGFDLDGVPMERTAYKAMLQPGQTGINLNYEDYNTFKV